jgi:hypothetical protein
MWKELQKKKHVAQASSTTQAPISTLTISDHEEFLRLKKRLDGADSLAARTNQPADARLLTASEKTRFDSLTMALIAEQRAYHAWYRTQTLSTRSQPTFLNSSAELQLSVSDRD